MSANPSPTTYNIKLKVKRGLDAHGDWEIAEPVGSTTQYSYHYSGGNDGGGNIRCKKKDGNDVIVIIQVSGTASETYSIVSVTTDADDHAQLTPMQVNATSWKITNRNTKPQSAYYNVRVKHDQSGDTFDCDPMMKNDPRP